MDEANFEAWVRVHDRVESGEMPPEKKARPEAPELNEALKTWSHRLTAMDSARQQRDGRSRLRRLNRVEFENTLRDLLAMPALKIKEDMPEDWTSHGFDRLAGAPDLSFVHLESCLAAGDRVLDAALCPFPEQPPVFKYRFRLTDNIRKNERIGSVPLISKAPCAIATATRAERPARI